MAMKLPEGSEVRKGFQGAVLFFAGLTHGGTARIRSNVIVSPEEHIRTQFRIIILGGECQPLCHLEEPRLITHPGVPSSRP